MLVDLKQNRENKAEPEARYPYCVVINSYSFGILFLNCTPEFNNWRKWHYPH